MKFYYFEMENNFAKYKLKIKKKTNLFLNT